MKKLEHFIRDNQELFDSEEPLDGHFERFETRLAQLQDQRVRLRPVQLWMKIAAGLLVLVTAGLAVFELATNDFTKRTGFEAAALGLPDDIREVISYYQQRSDQRLLEIENLAQNCPEPTGSRNTTNRDLAQLDKNLNDLVVSLKENPSDSRVQAALVQNYQARESLLDSYLLQANMENCKTKK
ncbi:MAG: hypothetical protein V1733_01700 [bacterium]